MCTSLHACLPTNVNCRYNHYTTEKYVLDCCFPPGGKPWGETQTLENWMENCFYFLAF